MAARTVMVTEPLCYVMTKYGKMPVDNIKAVMATFYDGGEIADAKDVVFKSVNDLKVNGAPRCVSRRKSDDKAKLDLDDIMGVVNFVDEQQMMESLPVFVTGGQPGARATIEVGCS